MRRSDGAEGAASQGDPGPPGQARASLLLLAVALVFVSLWALDYRYYPALYGDAVDYALAARELAVGQSHALFSTTRPPLFSALIALVARVTFLDTREALRFITLLAGLAAVLLTWRLVRRLSADAAPALLAATMTAVGIPAICGPRFAQLSDSLGLCCLIMGILGSAAAGAGSSVGMAAGAGLLWALAALTRSHYLPLGPAAALLFLSLNRNRRSHDAGPGAGPWARGRQLPWGRSLAFLCGWLIPVLLYNGMLSLASQQVTVTNAYDARIVFAPGIGLGRLHTVVGALGLSLIAALPLLMLSGLLLWAARRRGSSLGERAERTLPWVELTGALTLAIALASWATPRYFLGPQWCLWTLAAIRYASARGAASQKARNAAPSFWLRAAVLTCLPLAAASYPAFARYSRRRSPPPTPAYAAAAGWVNTRFGANARIGISGVSQTILYEVRSPYVLSLRREMQTGWSALAEWLRAQKPDVVLIGPSPGTSRRPVGLVWGALLQDPQSGRRVGLVYVRSFPAPEGTVHALVPAVPSHSPPISPPGGPPARGMTAIEPAWPQAEEGSRHVPLSRPDGLRDVGDDPPSPRSGDRG